MIEVELPDGTIAEFPDGTAPEVMKSALQRRFGAPAPQAPAQAAPQAPTAPQRGLGQRIYDNVIGDPNDGVTSTGEALGTWLNRAGESATLGIVGDEASAAATGMLPGRSYDSELQRYRGNEAGMSTAGRLSADLAGALAPGAGAAGAIGRGAGLLPRIGIGAALGGASGATYGFMEGEGDANSRYGDAATQGLIGAVAGGAIPAVGSALGSLFQGRASRRAIADAARGAPSSDELRAMGNALYRQVDEAGVQIKPEAFGSARERILEQLRANTGFDELPGPGSLTPNTSRVVQIMGEASNRMAAEPTAALPFRSLDQMRRQAGAAAGNVANKTDQGAGMAVINGLDDFVQRLGPDDVVAGDPQALKSAISKARDVWSRMSKSQMVDDAIERSENYLSGSASGVRNQFKNILSNKKLAARFTPAERAALRSVTHGSTLEQLINLAGGGLAQMGSIGGGFAAGGPLGALMGAGAAAGQRKLSEAVTMRAAERARAAIASGALRDPGISQALAIAGQRPERLTNSGLFAALMAGQQTTP